MNRNVRFTVTAVVDDNTSPGLLDTLAKGLGVHIRHAMFTKVDRPITSSWAYDVVDATPQQVTLEDERREGRY